MKTILYRIERHPHGWLVFGGERDGLPTFGIPLDSFSDLCKLCPEGVLDSGIAGARKAILALGTKEDCARWRKEIDEAVELSSCSPAEKWLNKTDVGVSSLSIFIALIGNKALEGEADWYYRSKFHPDIPHDVSDFGRCQRLLDLTPTWEAQLGKVAERFPETKWAKLAPRWPELKELYRAEKVFELTKELDNL